MLDGLKSNIFTDRELIAMQCALILRSGERGVYDNLSPGVMGKAVSIGTDGAKQKDLDLNILMQLVLQILDNALGKVMGGGSDSLVGFADKTNQNPIITPEPKRDIDGLDEFLKESK